MASVVAVRVAALHHAGPAGAEEADAEADAEADDGGWDVEGAATELPGLAEVCPGSVVPWVCGWLGPQAVSSSANAAAAVVITSPCLIR